MKKQSTALMIIAFALLVLGIISSQIPLHPYLTIGLFAVAIVVYIVYVALYYIRK